MEMVVLVDQVEEDEVQGEKEWHKWFHMKGKKNGKVYCLLSFFFFKRKGNFLVKVRYNNNNNNNDLKICPPQTSIKYLDI